MFKGISFHWFAANRISVFSAMIILLAYIRLYFGVDLTDEGGYIGIPYTFSLGARPFYDEIATTQNAGILLYPFVKLYTYLVPGADGLVLASRHIYFFLSLFAARTVFNYARRSMATTTALLISLLPITFIFCSRPNICYNTLGLFGLLIGSISFLDALSAFGKRALRSAAVGVFTLAMATYGYPTFIFVSGPIFLFFLTRVYLRFKGPSRLKMFACIVIASLPWLIFVVVSLHFAGMKNIRKSIEYYGMFGSNFGGIDKIVTHLGYLVTDYWGYGLSVIAGILAIWIMGTRLKIRWAVSLGIICWLIWKALTSTEPVADQLLLITFCGLVPFSLLSSSKTLPHVFEFKAFWILAVYSGILFTWTSGTGLSSASLGLLTASVLNLILAGVLMNEKRWPKPMVYTFEFVTSAFILFVLICSFRYLHQDGPFQSLNSVIASGPYAGIRTFFEKKQFLEELTSDLNAARPKAQSVMFFNDFPGGYLLTNLKRHSQSIWTPSVNPAFAHARTKNVLGYFDSNDKLPDLVVHLTSYYFMKGLLRIDDAKEDPVLDFFSRAPYIALITRKSYTIYEHVY